MVNKVEIEQVVGKNQKDKLHKFWQDQIDNAKSNHKWWLKESDRYYGIYYNTDNNYGYSNSFAFSFAGKSISFANTFNLFYSNVETRRPLIFSKLPEIDIRRRHDTKDRVSRIASEMLERVSNFFFENYGADISFNKVNLDKEVTGRGVCRLIFESGLKSAEVENEQGAKETVEDIDLDLKKIKIEFVPYDMFLVEPAKKWEDVTWISFTHQMSKSEVTKKFGKAKADSIEYTETSLDTPPDTEKARSKDDDDELKVLAARTVVYEIWDKEARKIYFYSPDLKKLLGSVEDSYNLKDFFPIPRPLGLFSNNNSLIPIPLLRRYLSKYEELQDLDSRLRNLTAQAKACYAVSSTAPAKDINALLNADDGVATPVKTIDPTGDLSRQIYAKDLTPIINAITVLTARQRQVIEDIREITGLSDILRGVSNASETATAQKLKGDFAISRLQLDQQEMQFFVRDVLRLQAELIAENYNIDELAQISGLNIINTRQIEQKVQFQAEEQNLDPEAAKQLAQQARQQIDSQLKTTFSATDIEIQQIDAILKNDKLRDFNIDIETESTVKVDNDIEKAQRIELTTAIANTLNILTPLQQTGQLTQQAVTELLGFIMRPFKVGRNLEEAILEKQDTTERDKKQEAMQQAQAQIENEERVEIPHRKLDLDEKKIDNEMKIKEGEIESEELQTELEADTDIKVANINAASRDNNKKEE